MPHTKYDSVITTNGALRAAATRASRAVSRSLPPGVTGGAGRRSTRPAIQADGIIASARIRKPRTPARHPWSTDRTCPIGAAIRAPTDPAAVTMPRAVLRCAGDTTRAATDSAIEAEANAMATPTSRPAPSMIVVMPPALASRAMPAT